MFGHTEINKWLILVGECLMSKYYFKQWLYIFHIRNDLMGTIYVYLLWLYTAHIFKRNSQYIKYDMYIRRHAAIKAVYSFPLRLVAKHIRSYIFVQHCMYIHIKLSDLPLCTYYAFILRCSIWSTDHRRSVKSWSMSLHMCMVFQCVIIVIILV